MRSRLPFLLASTACLVIACARTESEPKPDPSPPAAASGADAQAAAQGGGGLGARGARAAAAVRSAAPAEAPPSGPLVLVRGLRIVHAAREGDVAKVVRDEQSRAKADGRDLVVYVGAKWCEPCQRFHKAAEAGALDGDFPSLTLLEFDLDEDRERLVTAGYVSEFIPLFALPAADGRSSGKQFSGSVKGDGAVANIAPRLRGLVGK